MEIAISASSVDDLNEFHVADPVPRINSGAEIRNFEPRIRGRYILTSALGTAATK